MLTIGDVQLVRSGVRLLKRDGPGAVAVALLRLGLSPVLEFGRVVIFARDLGGTWPPPKVPAGLRLRLASPSDAPRLISGGRSDLRLAEQRFQRGDRCVVAVAEDGALAHSRWVTEIPTPLPELKMDIRPRLGEAYIYDGYTSPGARGLGIDGAVRCFIFDMLRAAGATRVYSYVRGNNGPGLRAASRWQRDIGEMWYLRVRGLRAVLIERRRDALDLGLEWPEVR